MRTTGVWKFVEAPFWGTAGLILLLLAGSVIGAFGQTATGNLTGTVTDAKGLAMTGVNVVVHNVDTGVDQKPVMTNDSGIYFVSALQPGTYDVTSTQTGFATVQHKGITVQVGQTVRIDVGMPVASQQSLVTVTTEAPLLETEKTEASQTINENLVTDLPISSRRWEQFVLLTPGLTTDGASGLISYHGINSQYNSNSVDGANNNNNYQSQARGGTNDGYIYSSDSIREFQVASSNFNAEIGMAAGGAINAVTKSGTNRLHGDLFYNMRNPVFNALDPVTRNNAAANTLIPTQPVHQQNQFGGSVGGPVPMLKDKLFYFVTYDGYRKVSPITYTTSAGASGTLPISGLVCPNPATVTAAQCAAAKNYILTQNLGTYPRELVQDVALAKLDYQVNQANHFNATFNWRNWAQPNGSAFAASNNSGLTASANSNIRDRFVIATWSTVIGSNKVNQLLYQFGQDNSFSSFRADEIAPGVTLSNLFGYGLNGVNPQHISEERQQFSDTFSFTMGSHAFKTGMDLNFTSTDVRSGQNVSGLYTYSSTVALPGSVTAGGGCTPSVSTAQTSNTIFCDWLVDLYGFNTGASTGKHWSTFAQSRDIRFPGNAPSVGAASILLHNKDVAGFFQDTWKIRSNVTVNMGLRYDVQLLPQLDSPCDTNTPLLAQYTCTTPNDYGGIQPRVAVAWNFSKKTVLRVGIGYFFAKTSVGIISSAHRTTGVREQAFNCKPSDAAPSLCAGLTFPNVLYAQQVAPPGAPFVSSTLGGANGNQPLTPQVTGLPGDNCVNSAQCGVRGVSPDLKSPRSVQGSIAIERQLPGNMSVSASYVFTRGTHLPAYWDVNMAPPTTKTYDVLSSATAPNTTVLAATVPFFTTRLNPVVTGGVPPGTGPIMAVFGDVSTWYHGMLLTVRKPMSHGVEFVANYTLAKATDTGETSSNTGGEVNFSNPGLLNPYERSGERGVSALDNRHRFTGSVVWSPTFAKNLSSRVARGALDGWNLSSTITATTGNPFSALIQSAAVQTGGLNGGPTASLLDASAFAMAGRVPWLPRDSYNLPSYHDVDVRLSKQFSLRERYTFEIRAEAFNLFNSTITQAVSQAAFNYSAPAASTTSSPTPPCWNGAITSGSGPAAGTVAHSNTCMVPVSTFLSPTTTSGNLLGARQMQFGFKFGF